MASLLLRLYRLICLGGTRKKGELHNFLSADMPYLCGGHAALAFYESEKAIPDCNRLTPIYIDSHCKFNKQHPASAF